MNIFAIIGASALGIVIILSILMIFGLPLGELTLGGQHRVFRGKTRLILLSQLILQIFFVVILLQKGDIMPLMFPFMVTKVICIVLAVYLSLNVFMNLFSKSKKERYIMTPLSLISAVCFWCVALMNQFELIYRALHHHRNSLLIKKHLLRRHYLDVHLDQL